MTQPTGNVRTPTPASRPARAPSHAPEPSRQDVQAMNDAFTAARKRQELTQGGTPKGKGAATAQNDATLKGADGRQPPAQQPQVGRHPADHEALSHEWERADTQGSAQGLGLTVAAAPVPVQVSAMPSPLVDPAAFAQLMNQLWARENGKGAKEVRVQFGSSAWPATGARIVRNAAGLLDIELHMGDRRSPDTAALDGLRGRFAEQGVALGALTTSDATG